MFYGETFIHTLKHTGIVCNVCKVQLGGWILDWIKRKNKWVNLNLKFHENIPTIYLFLLSIPGPGARSAKHFHLPYARSFVGLMLHLI